MIDILIPVLGRPHRVAPLLENIRSASSVEHHVLFLCSEGDRNEILEVRRSKADYLLFSGPPANGQYAKKINLGYRETSQPWLLLAADDIVFHPGWDTLALESAKNQFHIVSTNDKANYFVKSGLLATHSLVRREYADEQGCSLDGPGSIYHEGYSHNFVDCELSVLARDRGVFVFSRHSVLEHLHPAFRRGEMDTTYKHGNRDFSSDRLLFSKRLHMYARDPLVRRFSQVVRKEQEELKRVEAERLRRRTRAQRQNIPRRGRQ